MSKHCYYGITRLLKIELVYDEDAEYFEDLTPIQQFIEDIVSNRFPKVETLNLQGSILQPSGLTRLADDVLPLLPKVTNLDLYGCDLGDAAEALPVLLKILKTYKTITNINIVGTSLSLQILSLVKTQPLDAKLDSLLRQKVIFCFETRVQSILSNDDQWRQNHLDHYSHNPY